MADASNDLEEHGMVRTLKDLFAGAAGGIAQVLLGEILPPSFYKIVHALYFNSSIPYHVPSEEVGMCNQRRWVVLMPRFSLVVLFGVQI
jgi:hypothetical protein